MTGSRGFALLVDGYLRAPRWLRALAPMLAMAVLWWSSSRVPGDEPASIVRALLHNSMHIVAYACLAAAFWLTFAARPIAAVGAWCSRGSWLFAVAYGVVDELHQSFVPGRDSSLADVCSDALGAALGVVVLRAIVGELVGWRLPLSLLLMASVGSVAVATFGG